MKITFLSTLDDYWGGSEPLWVDTASSFTNNNHKLQVVVYKRKDVHPKIKSLQNKIANFQFLVSCNQIARSTFFIKAFYFLLRKVTPLFNIYSILKFNPDLIFINMPSTYQGMFSIDFKLLLTKYKGEYVILTHGNFEHVVLSHEEITIARKVFVNAKKNIFVSKRNKEATEHQLAMRLDNTAYTDYTLNIKKKGVIDYPNTECIQFASVARFDCKCKGQDLLLKVLSTNNWQARKWMLNFYGSGADEYYLKQLVLFYNIADKVIFHGHVNDITEIWNRNHILIMPSFAEGKPLALAEAMFCGRTAIVTDVAGNTELIKDKATGYVIPAPTYHLINETLERAWNDKSNWESLGINAHNYILEIYDQNPVETLSKIILEQ